VHGTPAIMSRSAVLPLIFQVLFAHSSVFTELQLCFFQPSSFLRNYFCKQGRNDVEESGAQCHGPGITVDGRRKVPAMQQIGYFLQYSTFTSKRP